MKPHLGDNERYLSLFGVIVASQHMMNVVQPDMRRIKLKFFQSDPDERIIFHRKDIARFRGPFSSLYADKAKRLSFGNVMLSMYEKWQYTAIIITIDKIAHLDHYSVWRYEPYHYCLAVMLERYVYFLRGRRVKGDVMIEARGTKPDQKLADSYRRLMQRGTNYVSAEWLQSAITSREIKIKSKKANIEGLQMADLLAHAAHYDHLYTERIIDKHKSHYSKKIARILRKKSTIDILNVASEDMAQKCCHKKTPRRAFRCTPARKPSAHINLH